MKHLSRFCACLRSDDREKHLPDDSSSRQDYLTTSKIDNSLRPGAGGDGSNDASLASSTQQIPSIHTLELYSPDRPPMMMQSDECSMEIVNERLHAIMLKKSSSTAVNLPSSRGSFSSMDGLCNSRNTLHMGMGTPSETSKSIEFCFNKRLSTDRDKSLSGDVNS